MAKPPSAIFICSNCDAQYPKWTGRCLECGQWGTIKEGVRPIGSATEAPRAGYAPIETKTLADLPKTGVTRLPTKIIEVDRVLGGGIVPGSLILLGGEPGIGKSTLSLQIAAGITNTLYLSAEESTEQIALRAARLTTPTNHIRFANTTSLERFIATIEATKPPLVIVDSIQTIASEEVDGEPGNLTQIRTCAAKLLEMAKRTGTPVIIIGHVTKEGALAGPKTLEHLVDTVLSFEGDRHHDLRILRAVKNRFGSTDELGLFAMTETGLMEVHNPSAALLSERGDHMPGSVVTCLIEGTRPMLVEIQALVNKTVFGYPARKASGFDLNRLHVLVAVLERRAGLALGGYDIHVNVVGGLTADEPAADLAVCLAIASAYKDKVLGNDLVAFGEVGLGGEIRSVAQLEKRLKECELLGMKRVITPPTKNKKIISTAKLMEVKNIQELITHT